MYRGEIKKFMIFLLAAAFLFLNPAEKSQGQVLKDSVSVRLISEGIESIYNMDFRVAEEVYAELARRHPGHPVCDLYRGMMIYWEGFPLTASSPGRAKYEKILRGCIEKSEPASYPPDGYSTEYLLANLSARGLLLLFYADNGLSSEVMPLASQTYRPLMRSMKLTNECPDFYFFSGVYNYYRDAYPKVRPVYKTVAFLFPQGNMKKGIEQLEICSNKAMALKAEALSMLSWIKMHFETDYQGALPYSKELYNRYPSNVLFRSMYIKNLLLLKKYNEAESVILSHSGSDTNAYYRAELLVFNGLLQEKKYRNNNAAKSLYKSAIEALVPFEAYGNEFTSYSYFGLSRLTQKEEEKQLKRMYRRKALDLTDFKKMTFDD